MSLKQNNSAEVDQASACALAHPGIHYAEPPTDFLYLVYDVSDDSPSPFACGAQCLPALCVAVTDKVLVFPPPLAIQGLINLVLPMAQCA